MLRGIYCDKIHGRGNRLRVFLNISVLKSVFGPEKDEVRIKWRKYAMNILVDNLYSLFNIDMLMKSRRVKYVGRVTSGISERYVEPLNILAKISTDENSLKTLSVGREIILKCILGSRLRCRGMDLCGSEYEPMAGCEFTVPLKAEIF
jgi:hypothetical protein